MEQWHLEATSRRGRTHSNVGRTQNSTVWKQTEKSFYSTWPLMSIKNTCTPHSILFVRAYTKSWICKPCLKDCLEAGGEYLRLASRHTEHEVAGRDNKLWREVYDSPHPLLCAWISLGRDKTDNCKIERRLRCFRSRRGHLWERDCSQSNGVTSA
jgi:hypothetical protein